MRSKAVCLDCSLRAALAVAILLSCAASIFATENVPHAPYAQWAEVPERGRLLVRAFYQESEAYHIWAGGRRHSVDYQKSGEHYGIDITQGFITVQYGLTERWAADLSAGYTTTGWRFFSNFDTNGASQSTSGLMDVSFGVRYQILNEAKAESPWTPTLTFRAGAVLPGSYEENFPFAPGIRSAAIEPELLLRKHFGWRGFGAYADGLFRWNRTKGNDQYIVSFGLFQQIKGWELSAGYRHLQTLSGPNLALSDRHISTTGPEPSAFASVRENNDAIEAGFSYTTPKRHITWAFYSRTVFDGNNTDKKFWVGGYVEVPFTLLKPK